MRFKGVSGWPLLLLAAILVVALGLRLHGVDWDQGFGYHPDERDIYMRSGCMYDLLTERPHHQECGYVADQPGAEPGLPGIGTALDADRSPLNPHWFPLGSILIYALVFFRSVAEVFTDLNPLEMRYAARPLAALADVGSVLLVFVLGRRLYGQGVGLLAAGLTAIAVIHVQHSHFYRPETFTVLFTLASLWAMLRMVERRRLRDSALLGLMLGLALAPKVNVLPLLAPLALAYFYWILDEADGVWTRITPGLAQRAAGHAAVAASVAILVFFFSSPYAFLDFGAFVGDVTAQTRMANNAGLWPFTVQYIDTPAFLYQMRQTTIWGLGIPLGIVAWIAIPFTIAFAVLGRHTRRADLLLLAWVVPSLLFLESFEVRFLRYLFPLMPVMVLLGSRMLLWEVDFCRAAADRFQHTGRVALRCLPALAVGVIVFVVAATAFYSLAFQRVYAEDHPATAAAQWMAAEVPRGTVVVHDNHWDEFIPGFYRLQDWQFPLYEADTPEKMEELASHLAASEYLLFYSARPYASASRDPERFPLSNAYYEKLFAGELGYRLQREYTSYPRLAGVAFRDDALPWAGLPPVEPEVANRQPNFTLELGYADDNVVGYDHPRVLIFRNADRLSEAELRRLLVPRPGGSSRHEARPVGLMLSDADLEKQREGGTYSEIVGRGSWTNKFPVLAWLLAVEGIWLLALPLAWYIFRPLPDRGIVLARILGLLAVSYVAWLVVSLGWLDSSRLAVYLGLGVTAAASSAVLCFQRREILGFARERWRFLLGVEALFLAAFLAFVLVRYANPDLWHPWRGGEKPMELAYLNAVLRSTSLPPYDPWFAGGYLNYYYWGYWVVSGLIRITGIAPTTAFNLAVPLFFALTVTGAFSLAYNLAEGVRRGTALSLAEPARRGLTYWRPRRSRDEALREWLRARLTGWRSGLFSPVSCGLTAGLFIAVIGNLDGIVQVAQYLWHGGWGGFDFWRSSRMIPVLDNFDPSPVAFWALDPLTGPAGEGYHITEFPFFTFLFADLHAHMMVIPFTLLVIGLGLCLVVGLRGARPLWTAAALAALALALGSLWVINSWDYPSYCVLTLGLLTLAACRSGRPFPASARWLLGAAFAVFLVSLLAFLPFHQSYETFNSWLDLSRWRTPLDRYLGIHGLFLFIAGTFIVCESRWAVITLWRSLRDREPVSTGVRWLCAAVALVILLVVFLGVTGYWTAAILLALLALTGMAAWGTHSLDGSGRGFAVTPLLLLSMALLISIGVDFVQVEGDIGRMNTLFKYYLEVWALLSVAAAYMLWRLASTGFLAGRWNWASIAWVAVLAVLVGSSFIYTALGTRDRLDSRFTELPGTLDGAAYMAAAVHWEKEQPFELKWDQEAIRWLQDNAEGSPVVLEAHTDQYRWGGRISSYTGLPTVLGWPWHQIQQREAYAFAVHDRAGHVREMYETTDTGRAIDLLRRYGVGYVVVGDLERIFYSGAGLEKFVELAEEGLAEKVFENQGITIYRGRW